MYCSSCGKEMAVTRGFCTTCGRPTTVFWLRFYSITTLAVIAVAALLYFYKLVPIAAFAHQMLGTEPFAVMRWQLVVSSFIQDWLLPLVPAAILVFIGFLRLADRLPAFFRSGHIVAIASWAATTLFLATVLCGFWEMAFLLANTLQQLHP